MRVLRLSPTRLVLLCCLQLLARVAPAETIDPYTLAPVKAACGPEEPIPPPSQGPIPTPPPLAPGKARIVVIAGPHRYHRSVRLGIDGTWFGRNGITGYQYIDVSPGIHHLCGATKGHFVLPHTSKAVALARVATSPGQTYYFFCGLGDDYHFNLTPINADEASMYLQSLPTPGATTTPPKRWQTPAVLAACGPKPLKPISNPPPLPTLLTAPEPGKALIYFFTDIPSTPGILLIGSPESVHLGIDGQWLGATLGSSYLATDVAPGTHSLCSASKFMLGVKPTIQLNQRTFIAGHTYYLDSQTLNPTDPDRAAFWLAKIAAMPASISQRRDVLNGYSRKEMPFLRSQLQACGIPPKNPTQPLPTPDPAAGTGVANNGSQIIFLFKSGQKLFMPKHFYDIGLDGRWAGTLRKSGWLAIPTTPGEHHVCTHINLRALAPGYSNAIFNLDSSEEVNSYVMTTFSLGDEYSPPVAHTTRLDPNEGALLTAFYPSADHPPH